MHIITLATSAKGGIDSVINGYESDGLFKDKTHTRITTHKGENKIEDLMLFISSIFRLFFISFKEKKLILHCHMSYKGSFWRKLTFVIISKLFNNKSIIHLHGSEFKIYFSSRNYISKKAMIWLIKSTDKFVVLSSGWQQYIKKISSVDSKVINNYVDVKPLETERKKGQIIFLAAFIKRKGIYELLEAFSTLKNDYHLHLCGSGENEKVETLIKDLNIEQSITLHGWIDTKKKVELLSSCSAMILPAFNEGLPMTIIESMGCKIPVISTPVGAIPEVIHDGESGYLVEPGNVNDIRNKIEYVLTNTEKSNKITENAYEIYRSNFTSAVILPKWNKLYEDLYNN